MIQLRRSRSERTGGAVYGRSVITYRRGSPADARMLFEIFEAGLHSVHHLKEADAAKCAVAAVSSHAGGLVVDVIAIERPADVVPGLEQALTSRRPVLLDVHADPDVVALPPHATFEQTKNFFHALAKGDVDRGRVLRSLFTQLQL